MHPLSMENMVYNLNTYASNVPLGSYVADIGSQDINGSYKPIVEPRWRYHGFDVQVGKNVDVIMPGEFDTGLPDNTADIVLSGQCLEHCTNPFKLATEIIRIAKSKGLLFITAPFSVHEHRYPIDCWRFLPDGMKLLFPEPLVTCITSYLVGPDCWFVGQKH